MKIKTICLLAVLILTTACNGNSTENIIEESGTIEATEVVVSSKVSGTVTNIFNGEGAFVRIGDTILVVDHETMEIKLRQADALLEAAKAKYDMLVNGSRKEDRLAAGEMLNISEVNFKSAQADKDRFEKLFAEKAITKKQFEDVENKFKIAEANYKTARANYAKINNIARPEEISQAKANLDQVSANRELIEKNIRDCYVTSAAEGYVVKQFVEEGEMVAPMTSLVKIINLKNIELVIYVSETDLGKIKLGQKAEVFVDSFPEKAFHGNVIFISSEAEFTPKNIQTKDERTKLVFAVKIKVANPEMELKPGMPADAKVFIN